MSNEIQQLPPEMPWKYKVAYLAYKFSQMDQAECPLKHSFHDGLYVREIFVPKDALFIGRVHKNGHIVRLTSGTVIDLHEGEETELTAPFEFRSYPGYQAVFRAVTDVVGESVHENPDESRDIQFLEDRDFEVADSLFQRGAMIAHELKEDVPWLA